MMAKNTLRIGTRGSKLALFQANKVKAEIEKTGAYDAVEICVIKTEGDENQTSPLSELGGKGVFIKTIETALSENRIDLAVHSLKDITATSSDDLELSGYLEAESRFDCLICRPDLKEKTLETLPKSSLIGTSSMRRQAILSKQRPDLKFKSIRGNIDTRITRCLAGEFDGILLSMAGVIRLGYEELVSQVLTQDSMIPAPGQGVIALQTRKTDLQSGDIARRIGDAHTKAWCQVENEILKQIGLGCDYPFGIWSDFVGDMWHAQVFIARSLDENHLIFKLKEKKENALQKARELGGFLKHHIDGVVQ